MTLKVNSLLCHRRYACFDSLTKGLRLESRGLPYKVALNLSYLNIKFDDEIKGNPFEFQAYCPICLRPKLNWVYVWLYLQPDIAVTETCGNEQTCDK